MTHSHLLSLRNVAARRSRGSVLLLVVSLLVLLALMATAYLSSVRLDATAASPTGQTTALNIPSQTMGADPATLQQQLSNTRARVLEAITRDLYSTVNGTTYFRRPGGYADPTSAAVVDAYEDIDSGLLVRYTTNGTNRFPVRVSTDTFLASRYPERRDIFPGAVAEDSLRPYWPAISWIDLTSSSYQPYRRLGPTDDVDVDPAATSPLTSTDLEDGDRMNGGTGVAYADNSDDQSYFSVNNALNTSNLNFRDPRWDLNGAANDAGQGSSLVDSPTDPDGQIKVRTHLIPSYVEVAPNPVGTSTYRRLYPAFDVDGDPATVADRFLAADADGDNIADSGLVYLGTSNGLHYYAGVRVVDNAAAVNLNTAFFRERELGSETSTGPLTYPANDLNGNESFLAAIHANRAFFRSNIGLFEGIASQGRMTLDLDQDNDVSPFTGANASVNNAAQVFGQFDDRAAEMRVLRNGRTGVSGSGANVWVRAGDVTSANALLDSDPMVDTSNKRLDFDYFSQGDAFEFQFARRLDEPSPNGRASIFSRFSESATLALAVPPGMFNPFTPSAIDSLLLRTLTQPAINYYPTRPGTAITAIPAPNFALAFSNLPPSKLTTGAGIVGDFFTVDYWFNVNHNHDDTDGTVTRALFLGGISAAGYSGVANFTAAEITTMLGASARAQVVTSNPISSSAPLPRFDTGNLPATEAGRVHPPTLNPDMVAQPDRFFFVESPLVGTSIETVPAARVHDYRVGLNTARFRDLWRGFWAAMADPTNGTRPFDVNPAIDDDTDASPTTYAAAPELDPAKLVSIGAFTGTTDEQQAITLQLRSAIAAVNVEDARDSDENVTVRVIDLYGADSVNRQRSASPVLRAVVYGQERQAYLSRAIIQQKSTVLAGQPSTSATESIELLFSVYGGDGTPVSISGWEARILSASGALITSVALTAPAVNSGGAQHVVVAASGLSEIDAPAGATEVLGVTALNTALKSASTGGLRIQLVRPALVGGTMTNAVDSVVVDEIDLSMSADLPNIPMGDVNLPVADFNRYRLHTYRRNRNFDHSVAFPGPRANSQNATNGFEVVEVQTSGTSDNSPPTITEIIFSTFNGESVSFQIGGNPTDQLIASDPATTPARFPFGAFARDADIARIPFFGHFAIAAAGTGVPSPTFVLPATADINMIRTSAFTADLTVAEADASIGRFVPASDSSSPDTAAYDISSSVAGSRTISSAQYVKPLDWRGRALQFVSAIHNPGDDAIPNLALPLGDTLPTSNLYNAATDEANGFFRTQSGAWRWSSGGTEITTDLVANTPVPVPVAVANTPGVTANSDADKRTPIEGKININTAGVQVLNQLPLAYNGATGEIEPEANLAIAREIVENRRVNGPFRSIYDLNRVAAFRDPSVSTNYTLGAPSPLPAGVPQNANSSVVSIGGDTTIYGDYSPDAILGDLEDRNANVIRLSNLISTRSDSFTVYIVVQAWAPASGTTPPRAVGERRMAMTVDRSQITGSDTPEAAIGKLRLREIVLP
jgi:hypothetical protein